MDVLLASVAQLVEDGRFGEVAGVLDNAELEEPSALSSEQWPHALHLLAHIYASRLEDARFLYKRTPAAIQQGSPELQAAFGLLQRLWVKDYQHVWAALQFQWGAQAHALAAAIAKQLRQQMLELVGGAYSTIALPKLAALLGSSEEEAAQAAAGRGWQAAEGGLVAVAPPQAKGGAGEAEVRHSLQRLAEYVVHLET